MLFRSLMQADGYTTLAATLAALPDRNRRLKRAANLSYSCSAGHYTTESLDAVDPELARIFEAFIQDGGSVRTPYRTDNRWYLFHAFRRTPKRNLL